MWRLLLLVSVLPIAAALIARWWFGLRVLGSETGKRPCRCDAAKWPGAPLAGQPIPADATAAEYGRLLRLAALKAWRERDRKAANSRENARRFGIAVPPLSGVVSVFAVIVAKIPPLGAISVVLAATALSCVLGLLSLPAELRAMAPAVRQLRDSRAFTRRDDEDAVVEAAVAHVWKETLPPILAMLQR